MFSYKVYILLFCFLFSSKITYKSETYSDCRLFSKNFEIDKKTFKDFENQIGLFISQNNDYDILKIYYSGGNDRKHRLTRWYTNGKKLRRIDEIGEKTIDSVFSYNHESFVSYFNLIENKSLMQFCPYSSNNDTYTILIKEKGNLKFKYISTSRNYNVLNTEELNKMSGVLKFIKFLNSNRKP